jgi:hypothetical protein
MAPAKTTELPHEVPRGISPVDFAALKLTLERCRASSQDRSRQIDAMLADRSRSWASVAEFCAYDRQMDNLHLKPWEHPPAHVNDPDHPQPGEETAAALLRRMLHAGIPRWHPDPLVALEAAERTT